MIPTPLEQNAEAQILALTASIERIETRWPHRRTTTELSKALRRQRGAWKLYRDGIFAEPPPRITSPLIISCFPCPSIEGLQIPEPTETEKEDATPHVTPQVDIPEIAEPLIERVS